MVKIKQENFPEEPEAPKAPVVKSAANKKLVTTGRSKAGWKILIGIVVLLALGFVGAQAAMRYAGGANFLSKLIPGKTILKGESNGRVNIAILGYPGDPAYDGPQLTDTMIVASLSTDSQGKNIIFSIPRDLYVDIPNYGNSKINATFEIGDSEFKDGPGTLKTVLKNVTGLNIDYYMSMDFAGFEKLVDELGGITVTVDKDLYDTQYPDGKGGYQLVDIKAGTYKMDGATALKYARSRQSTSDFDRSARQQKIIVAIRDKAQSLNLLSNPSKALALYNILKDHFSTDATWRELLRMTQLFGGLDPSQITTKVFSDASGELYATKSSDGAYILKPAGDNFTVIQTAVQNLITGQAVAATDTNPAPMKVEVLNGTFITGLAAKIATKLRAEGQTIVMTGNNPTRDVTQTTVYDLTGGAKTSDTAKLAAFLKAQVGTDTTKKGVSGAEVLVVLGPDAASL